MHKIIVTGGTGYIGSHTIVSLIEQGFEPVVIDNLANSSIEVLNRIEEITGVVPEFAKIDMTNEHQLFEFLQHHQDTKAVIHFAALKAVKDSVEKPIMYYKNNLCSLINLIEGMVSLNIPNLIFSSSATVYGEVENLPITEKHSTKRGTSPYGNTKKVGEEIIEDCTNTYASFRAISLRYFNPIGAHSSSLIGELPTGIPNNLMPFITQTAAGIRKELLVYGDNYKTVDGTAIRDYLHVQDLAEAHVCALRRLLKKSAQLKFEVFNIGTGKGSSVLDVITSFEKSTGQKVKYRIVKRRKGDVAELYASTELSNKKLGWKARFNLDTMTQSAWAWEKKLRMITD